jgi:hypothetical protein
MGLSRWGWGSPLICIYCGYSIVAARANPAKVEDYCDKDLLQLIGLARTFVESQNSIDGLNDGLEKASEQTTHFYQ